MEINDSLESDINLSNGSNLNKTEMKNQEANVTSKDIKDNREEIKQLLNEDLTNFLAQAILKTIFTPHLILKIFLSVCVLVSSVLASYLVVQSILDFFTYGVATTSRIYFDTPTLFPKVTFCNLNPFTTEYAWNLKKKGLSKYNFQSLSSHEKQLLSHSLEDILFECMFNNDYCSQADFIWSSDESYGSCYTFNSGFDSNGRKKDLKISTIAGPVVGLQLTLYVNIYEKFLSEIFQRGAIIRIGNSSYSIDYHHDGLFVTPGSSTYISIGREFKSMLPRPYSNCDIYENTPKFLEGMDLYNLIIQSDYKYTQQLCFYQCYQKYIILTHNCTVPNYLSLFNATKCSSKILGLINNSSGLFSSQFINEHCISLCPLECDQQLFKTSLSSGHLNSNPNFFQNIKEKLNLSRDFIYRDIRDDVILRESFIYVNLYYESLSYTLTTESPQVDLVSMLGSIGGNLGLFLGVSVFSLFEIIEVIIEIVFIFKREKIVVPTLNN